MDAMITNQVAKGRPVAIYNAGHSLCGDCMPLKVGDPAPNFALPAVIGERHTSVCLRDYLGKQNVVITFHPLDWTPT